jgi:hypothetical protein
VVSIITSTFQTKMVMYYFSISLAGCGIQVFHFAALDWVPDVFCGRPIVSADAQQL